MNDKREFQIGDAPIEEKYYGKMQFLAREIDGFFNGANRGKDRKVGFVMMIFDFGDTGRANYISNADRGDIKILLREQLARFEGQPKG